MEEIKNRILDVIKMHGISIRQLCKKDANLQMKMSRQLHGDALMTLDVILCVLNAFPELSADYLIKGINQSAEPQELPKGIVSRLAEQDATIARQAAEIEEKDKTIAKLVNKLCDA